MQKKISLIADLSNENFTDQRLSPLAEKLFARLEKSINYALSYDRDSLREIATLSGKVISFEFINTDIILYVFPGDEGFRFLAGFDGDVSVRIRGTPLDMLSYLMATKAESATFTGSMEIIGDVGLAQRIQSIMKNIDFDWEEHLSHWLGDTLAHKFSNALRSTLRFGNEAKTTLAMDMSEYLRFENSTLPDQAEIDQFSSSVDELRDDVERLKIRIEKICRVSETGG
ncbi:MAG: SCP2 sterol-binding domain-containing protein [Gammaproteobacteria bacterium]|nr:SCP2 sterol-binding domain-containing protein [Gammaproteobacteria bacterium]